jgi:hypothetical protein
MPNKTRVAVTMTVRDADVTILALLYFAGAVRNERPKEADRASKVAKDLATALNLINPTDRPVAKPGKAPTAGRNGVCRHGHPLDRATRGRRWCSTCNSAAWRRRNRDDKET